jgi:uncharacterized protein YqgV (UPF0045/DUF77 family)
MATNDLTVGRSAAPTIRGSPYVAEIQPRLAAQERSLLAAGGGTSLGGATAHVLAVVAELHAVPFDQGDRASTPS